MCISDLYTTLNNIALIELRLNAKPTYFNTKKVFLRCFVVFCGVLRCFAVFCGDSMERYFYCVFFSSFCKFNRGICLGVPQRSYGSDIYAPRFGFIQTGSIQDQPPFAVLSLRIYVFNQFKIVVFKCLF